MERTKKISSFNLLSYASAAACYLGIHNDVCGQVVYTDVDPDLIFDERLEGGGLDIDNNGTIDFLFLNSSFTFYNYIFGSYRLKQDIIAGPAIPSNAIAGIYNTWSNGSDVFTIYYPYALMAGEVINNSLQWQNEDYQILAMRTLYETGDICGMAFSCNWYNFDIEETIDHYLGIRFTDEDHNNYFGWIRCDVKDEGRTLIIKDYAYEVIPEHPIVAGDTLHYVSVENQNMLEASVYVIEDNLHVLLKDFENEAQILIYDLAGRLLHSQKISDKAIVIELNFPNGNYFINIFSDSGRFTKQIYLN